MRRIAAAMMVAALAMVPLAARDGASRTQSEGVFSLAFLYDVTMSATDWDLRTPAMPPPETKSQYTKAIDALVRSVRPRDIVRFGLVSSHLVLDAPLGEQERRRLPDLDPVIPGADRSGPSPLWDELYDAATTIAHDPHAAILLVTDCRPTGNVHGMQDLVLHARATHVSISTIVEDALMRRVGSPAPRGPIEMCASLAGATAGLSEFDDGKNPHGDIGHVVEYMIRELRGR